MKPHTRVWVKVWETMRSSRKTEKKEEPPSRCIIKMPLQVMKAHWTGTLAKTKGFPKDRS